MKDLMIDIETMGTAHNAVMIQLAGVFFDRDTGELGREFCINISEESCESHGFTKDPKTIEWWNKQDQAILDNIRTDAFPIEVAIISFYKFYLMVKDVKVWSHATFDFVIVQNYLQKFDRSMNHKHARDIRTLVDLSGINLKQYDWTKKTHNALDDCKFQAQYCVDALKALKQASRDNLTTIAS